MTTTLTLASLARVLVAARAELAASETILNSLNVYPVPDGDTGTNMRATLEAGLRAVEELDPGARTARSALRQVLGAITREAQGNSGVILSEYVRGFVGALGALPPDGVDEAVALGLDGDALARALHSGASSARGAVDNPVEGTMLSVAEAAAVAASHARSEAVHSGETPQVDDVAQAAFDGAKLALSRSPQQLAVLAEAGVVDAGGAGLAIVLECLSRVASGRHGLPRASERSWLPRAEARSVRSEGGCQVTSDGPAFEVMGVIEGLTDEMAASLRSRLAEVGDSVVVAGGDGIHRLHVHTDLPLVAVSHARDAGSVNNIAVTRFAGGLDTVSDVVVVAQDEAVQRYARSLGAAVSERIAEADNGSTLVLADRGTPGDGARSHSLVTLLAGLDAVATGFDADEEIEVLQAGTWRAARDLVRSHFEGAEVVTACIAPDAEPAAAEQFVTFLEAEAERVGAELDLLRLRSGFLVQLGVIHE
ncbi:DAK2 domain-containing protein [Dermacoccus barathri]|uniref:DAK2 domain-containing protein n=1 Tax=Dermacoccus barathri TaxID=322601 RepID=UPI001879646D|nr:DAK2 domain-containing protein [Dermacoccus barathri]MBE7371017.1 DAK2 domain-containing protein [Dermacoccus barathri]